MHSTYIFLTYASSLLFLASSATVFPRFEINDVMSLPTLTKQRDLLVLALRTALDMNPENPRSFYQIGGIHGMPAKPYMNVTNQTSPYSNETAASRWMGYCEHGKRS